MAGGMSGAVNVIFRFLAPTGPRRVAGGEAKRSPRYWSAAMSGVVNVIFRLLAPTGPRRVAGGEAKRSPRYAWPKSPSPEGAQEPRLPSPLPGLVVGTPYCPGAAEALRPRLQPAAPAGASQKEED